MGSLSMMLYLLYLGSGLTDSFHASDQQEDVSTRPKSRPVKMVYTPTTPIFRSFIVDRPVESVVTILSFQGIPGTAHNNMLYYRISLPT